MNYEQSHTQNHETEQEHNWNAITPESPAHIELEEGNVDQYIEVFAGNPEDADSADPNDLRRFKVLDVRTNKTIDGHQIGDGVDYLIVQEGTLDFANGRGYRGLRKGDYMEFGRTVNDRRLHDRMDLNNPYISRNHFSIAVDTDGSLLIGDNGSSNGTQYEIGGSIHEGGSKVESRDNEVALSPERRAQLERAFYLAEPFDPDAALPDRFGNRRDQRGRTTPESVEQAKLAMRYVDSKIKDIYLNAVIEQGIDLSQTTPNEIIRTNHELRADILVYLLDKLDDPDYKLRLPSRFYGQSLKSPNHSGYEDKLTSREYAGLLALSMLDGTFKGRASDPIEVPGYGKETVGQHRYAAMQALFSDPETGMDNGYIKRYAGDQIQ